MKKTIFLLLMSMALFNTLLVQASTFSKVKTVINQFESGKIDVGVYVYSLTKNKEIFSYKADQLLNPASNAKVLSSAAAFNKLGPDFRFETRFYTDERTGSQIHNLYVVGGGDPQLTEDKIDLIARGLAQSGIRTITGDVIIDQSFFDKRGFGDSMGKSGTFTTPLNALVVNFNRYGVIVKPRKSKLEVKLDFPNDYVSIKNEARIGKGKLSVTKKYEGGKEKVFVRGATRGKNEQIFYRDVSQPSLFAGYFIKAFLEKKGINVVGRAKEGVVPSQSIHLYTHQSDPLLEIVKVMNKRSINFTAEMVTKYLGARFEGVPGTTAKGADVVSSYLKSVGISSQDFSIENGSGLSRLTRITPRALTKVFKDVSTHPSYYKKYVETLAVAGEDGTVRKRFCYSKLKGKAFLKTGTLNGVSSLAGYVQAPNGDDLVFAILMNGKALNSSKAHLCQESILDVIVEE